MGNVTLFYIKVCASHSSPREPWEGAWVVREDTVLGDLFTFRWCWAGGRLEVRRRRQRNVEIHF